MKNKINIKIKSNNRNEKLIINSQTASSGNVIGKIYKITSNSILKINKVNKVINNFLCIVEGVKINLDENLNTELCTNYVTEINLFSIKEVSSKRFTEKLEEAIQCLRYKSE